MAAGSTDKFETWGESEGREHRKKFHELTDTTASSTYVAEEIFAVNDTAHPLNIAGSIVVTSGVIATSTDVTAKQGLASSLNPWFVQNDSSHALTIQGNATIAGNATVFQGTTPWGISGNTTVVQGTSPWVIGGNATVAQGPASSLNPWFIQNDSSHAITIQGNATVAISGNATVAQGTGSTANPWSITNDSSHALFVQGTTDVTAKQGTPSSANPWFVQNDSSHAITIQGNSSVVISGNATVAQGPPSSLNPWFIQNDSSHALTVAAHSVNQGTPSSANPWFVQNDSSHALTIQGNSSVVISGNATVAQGAGSSANFWFVTNDSSHAITIQGNSSVVISGNATVAQGTPSSANPWFVQNDSSHQLLLAPGEGSTNVTITTAQTTGTNISVINTTGIPQQLIVSMRPTIVNTAAIPFRILFTDDAGNSVKGEAFQIAPSANVGNAPSTALSIGAAQATNVVSAWVVPTMGKNANLQLAAAFTSGTVLASMRTMRQTPLTPVQVVGGPITGSTDVTAKQGTPSSANPWFIQNDSSHAITIQGNATVAISGNATVAQGAGSSANYWFVKNDSSNAITIQGNSSVVISGNATVAQGAASSANAWFVSPTGSSGSASWTSANPAGTRLSLATTGFVNGVLFLLSVGAAGTPAPLLFQNLDPTVGNQSVAAMRVDSTGVVTMTSFTPALSNTYVIYLPAYTSGASIFLKSTLSGGASYNAKLRAVVAPPLINRGVTQGTPSSANPWFVQNDSSHAITIQGNATVAISGNATVAQGAPSSANPWFIQNDSSHALTVQGNTTVVQGTNPWVVRTIQDATRVEVSLVVAGVALTSVLALQNLFPTTQGVVGGGLTDYVVSSGRTFNIQTIDLSVEFQSSGAAARGVYVLLVGKFQSGATTVTAATSSGLWQITLGPSGGINVQDEVFTFHTDFPQGLRVPALTSASHLGLAALLDANLALLSSVFLTGTINGFEYF